MINTNEKLISSHNYIKNQLPFYITFILPLVKRQINSYVVPCSLQWRIESGYTIEQLIPANGSNIVGKLLTFKLKKNGSVSRKKTVELFLNYWFAFIKMSFVVLRKDVLCSLFSYYWYRFFFLQYSYSLSYFYYFFSSSFETFVILT